MHFPSSRTALIAAVAAVLSLAGCSRNQRAEAPADETIIVPVAAEPAQVGRLRAVLHVSGVVTPSQGAEFLVVASEPARIVEITRMEGEPVNAGDVLVRFEAPSATQEAARQRAEVARAQVQLENARVAQARTQDLVSRGLVPRNEIDTAERELAEAQTQVARADAARIAAETAVARATVRAPFAGIVAKRLHNVGDVAQASTTDPVLRVIDPRRLEVQASIPAADAARVLPGASARLATLVDGKQVPLSVASQINSAERNADGSVRVRLTFLEPPKPPRRYSRTGRHRR
jgi:RND family efflux transporter MFP subunit